MPQDGPQLGNPKTAKVFNDNFFRDFRKLLGADSPIVKLSLCDFSVRGGGRGHGSVCACVWRWRMGLRRGVRRVCAPAMRTHCLADPRGGAVTGPPRMRRHVIMDQPSEPSVGRVVYDVMCGSTA